MRNEAYGVVVKNGPRKASQIGDKRIADERSREAQIFLQTYFPRSIPKLRRLGFDGNGDDLIGSIAAENMG